MSTENDDTEPKTEAMFTRAQMAREVNRQVREKVAEALAGFADYDDLKAKAAEADKSKSQLDRIEQQLAVQTERADKMERDSLIRSVAEELGISLRLAKRLEGKTREDLLADGRETMEDLGITPKGQGTSTAAENGNAGNGGDDNDDRDQNQQQAPNPEPQESARRAQRPREDLQSGAPRTPTVPDETDPLKLAALIPRR